MPLRILALGDIVGRPGRQIVHQKLPCLVRQRQDRLYRALLKRLRAQSKVELNEPVVRSLDQG